jgi:aspartyl-tRNA(Asn)/glutamyl-tRNA(Gln) amidotransferase subunit A
MAIAWSMDKLGPMARSADCCGLVLSVIGNDFQYAPAAHAKPLRIGKLTNAFTRFAPGLELAIDAAAQAMEKGGAKVSDAALPDGPFEDAAELTILMEATAAFQDMIHSGSCAQLVDPLGKINGYISEELSAADYLQVQRVRAILQRRVDKLFDQFDVIATAGSGTAAQRLVPAPRTPAQPAAPRPAAAAPTVDNSQRAPDGVSSLCGLPALSVPCGFSSENLPYGIQFIARAGNDHAVIDAARQFQSLTDWHKRRPTIA